MLLDVRVCLLGCGLNLILYDTVSRMHTDLAQIRAAEARRRENEDEMTRRKEEERKKNDPTHHMTEQEIQAHKERDLSFVLLSLC